MDSNTPAKQATAQYFTNTNTECFKGRPRTTLPGLLDKDIKQAHAQQKANSPLNLLPTQLKGPSDYLELERLANDRSTWRSIVANMDVFEPPKPMVRPRRHANQ